MIEGPFTFTALQERAFLNLESGSLGLRLEVEKLNVGLFFKFPQ